MLWLLRLGVTIDLLRILEVTTGASLIFVLLNLLSLYVVDGYNPTCDFRRPQPLLRLPLGVGVALTVQAATSYISPWHFAEGGRGSTLLSYGIFALLVIGSRWATARLKPVRSSPKRTLILGAGAAGVDILEAIHSHPEADLRSRVIGFLDDDPDAPGAELAPILGDFDQTARILREQRIGLVIVAIAHDMPAGVARPLLHAKARGVQVMDMLTQYKWLTGRVPLKHLNDAWLVFGPGFNSGGPALRAMQRVVDVTLSAAGLLLASPALLLAAIAVKASSRGPVLYRQDRVGLDGRLFTIVKLRTMRQEAEAHSGPVWSKGRSDPRLTPVGGFLRRSRMDELPQLWNVLRGDMAFVGPRPEREVFVREFEKSIPFYTLRHAVRPGVTGWAQVSFRYAAGEKDAAIKLEYELYAIQEMNPALYLLILLKTLQTVLVRPGS